MVKSDIPLIDGYQERSKVILNKIYVWAMVSSRFTVNIKRQNESQNSSTFLMFNIALIANIPMNMYGGSDRLV